MGGLFNFSKTQLRFVGFLAGLLVVLASIQFMRSHADPIGDAPLMSVVAPMAAESYKGIHQMDPNTAPADSLELLVGIGPVLAQRIVAYRSEQRFERVEDIQNVPGIGEKTFLEIRQFLRVDGE